jgi:hypothetical protein
MYDILDELKFKEDVDIILLSTIESKIRIVFRELSLIIRRKAQLPELEVWNAWSKSKLSRVYVTFFHNRNQFIRRENKIQIIPKGAR